MGTLKIKVGGQSIAIPRGPKGDTGPANVLTKGTVTTGAPGSAADVTISGTSPNQTIDFTIPRGDTGQAGPAGSVVSASSSTSEYRTVVERRTLPYQQGVVELGTLTTPNSAAVLRIEIIAQQPSGGHSNSRFYDLAVGYAASTDWYLIPSTSYGLGSDYTSTAAYKVYLEGQTNGDVTKLRVRSSSGNAGNNVDLTAVIHIVGDGITWTPTSATITGTSLPTSHTPSTSYGLSGVAVRSEQMATTTTMGGTVILSCYETMVHKVTLGANITSLIFIGVDQAPGRAVSITLILIQDATGGRTITWPASFKWPNGVAPTLITTPNAINVVTLMTYDHGTTWLGFLSGAGMA